MLKDVSDLMAHFVDELKSRIHEIHSLMDKYQNEKDLILKKIEDLRIEISKIIISYENLYGTTEILEEEKK